jgi:hypothetical protein
VLRSRASGGAPRMNEDERMASRVLSWSATSHGKANACVLLEAQDARRPSISACLWLLKEKATCCGKALSCVFSVTGCFLLSLDSRICCSNQIWKWKSFPRRHGPTSKSWLWRAAGISDVRTHLPGAAAALSGTGPVTTCQT